MYKAPRHLETLQRLDVEMLPLYLDAYQGFVVGVRGDGSALMGVCPKSVSNIQF